MGTIEERAWEYAGNVAKDVGCNPKDLIWTRGAYMSGAKEQQEIDIERAWEFISKHCTFIHPRKDEEVCMINKGAFIDFIKE